MGLSLKNLREGFRDIFDANTERDYAKRAEAQRKASLPVVRQSYAEEQRAKGNNRPNQNFGQALLSSTARVANTVFNYNTDTLPKVGAALFFKAGNRLNLVNDRDYINAVNYITKDATKKYTDTGGLFNAGTVFDNPQELENADFGTVARKSLAYGAGTYGEIAPGMKGGGILKRTLTGAGEAIIGDAGYQYGNTGKVDPLQSAQAAVFGSAMPNVVPALRGIAGKFAGKADEVVPTKIDVKGPRGYSKKVDISESPVTRVDNIRKVINAMPNDKSLQAAKLQAKRRLAEQSRNASPEMKVRLKARYEEVKVNIENVKKQRVALASEADAIKSHPAYKNARPIGKITSRGVDSEMLQPGKPKVSVKEVVAPDVPTPALKPQVYETSINKADPMGNKTIIKQLRNKLGELVDDDATMLTLLRKIEKETGRTGLVDQFYFDSGNVRASNSIANSVLQNSEGFKSAVSGLSKKELRELDEYAGARAELTNYDGKKTSKSKAQNSAIVSSMEATYGERYNALNRHYKELAERLYQAGIISGKKLGFYQQSGDYIKIQRDVSDLVSPNTAGASQSRSLASTSTRFKRRGSERDIISPVRTAMERTQQVELEIQRNIAANNLVDTLQSVGLATGVKEPRNQNVISRFKNGKREQFEVHGDIKKVIDNVNPYQMDVLSQIISYPTRLAKAGLTGLNVPFAAVNYIRDQLGSAIYSKNTASTHGPINIVSSLASATMDFVHESRHPLWKEFNQFLGDQTQFSELRNAKSTKKVLREARMGAAGVAINRAVSPIKSIEDLISITEKATRFQNFKGTYNKVMRETGDYNTAIREAVLAGRKNSVDFQRSSKFTRAASLFIPYFNAGVQGSRTMAVALKERPAGTLMKTTALIGMPTMAAVAWNMSDDKRREAYQSINEYEKKDNFIIIGPDAKQTPSGSWTGIYKIPKPQGYRELSDPMRVATEKYFDSKTAVEVDGMLVDMLGAFTGPLETDDPQRAIGSVTPQVIKPTVQFGMNKDLYSGNETVPDFMNEATDANGNPVAESDKAYKGTSGSMKILGKLTGQSPLKVEKLITDSTGSVGRYAINATDNTLAKQGKISQDEIGGRSIPGDFSRRLFEASGKLLDENKSDSRKYFENVEKHTAKLTQNEKAAWKSLHPVKNNFLGDQIYEYDKAYSPAARLDIYNRYPKVFEADKALDAEYRKQGKPGNPLFDLTKEQVKKVLEKDNLPAGAKDPELSNLYTQSWYKDYQALRSDFFGKLKAGAEAEGKTFGSTDNPYPDAGEGVQSALDYYNTLPKGTGERSAFIRQNPEVWNAMQGHFAAIDTWQNKQREKRGLDATEGATGEANGYASSTNSTSSYSRSGGGGGRRSSALSNTENFTVSNAPVGGRLKVKSLGGKTVQLRSTKTSTKKPKVTIKKSKV